jgi:DNA polymerase/3'-5' exonuclease PolX
MKVYEVLFVLNKHLQDSIIKNPKSGTYIKIAYGNVINKIKENHDINGNINKSDIDALCITQYMNDKLSSIITQKINTSDAKKLKKSHLFNELSGIAGIGKKKAMELINLGLSDIKQLSMKKWVPHLNSGTLLLIKNKPLKRIPHEIIKKLERRFISFKHAPVKLVGGFMRKKPFSKDIDVMIISDKKTIITDYIKYLEMHFLELYVYAEGGDKASLIVKYKTKFLKVDLFRSPVKYQHAMLLYAIGSKKTNVKMRCLAKRKGYTLNQYGLFKLKNSDKKNNKPVAVKSERDFFNILGIPYILPVNR